MYSLEDFDMITKLFRKDYTMKVEFRYHNTRYHAIIFYETAGFVHGSYKALFSIRVIRLPGATNFSYPSAKELFNKTSDLKNILTKHVFAYQEVQDMFNEIYHDIQHEKCIEFILRYGV